MLPFYACIPAESRDAVLYLRTRCAIFGIERVPRAMVTLSSTKAVPLLTNVWKSSARKCLEIFSPKGIQRRTIANGKTIGTGMQL